MQRSFSELEYAAKKKQTRRDRFLSEIDQATPWGKLHQLVEPYYPKNQGAGRPPIGLARRRTGCHADCRTTLDQESRQRTRPGNASNQEGQRLAFWDEGAYVMRAIKGPNNVRRIARLR